MGKRMNTFMNNVFGVFGLSGGYFKVLSNTTQKWSDKLQKRIRDRERKLPRGDQTHRLRLNETELEMFLPLACNLVKDFVSDRIFKQIYHSSESMIAEFWANKDVVPDDWNSLMRAFVSSEFSQEFLTPLTESDCSVQLDIKHPSVRNFLKMIHEDRPADDLENARVTVSNVEGGLLSRLLDSTRFSLDFFTFGFHRGTFASQTNSNSIKSCTSMG